MGELYFFYSNLVDKLRCWHVGNSTLRSFHVRTVLQQPMCYCYCNAVQRLYRTRMATGDLSSAFGIINGMA